MIDIHTHIIPFIDDGSISEEVSIEMLKIAYLSGTRKIVLTPHYYRGKYTVPIDVVKKHLKKMKKIAEDHRIDIEIFAGQEIYFTPSLLEDLDNKEIGTINDTRYILIEFNLESFDYEIFDVLHELKIRGLVPIIAHPERYKEFQKKPSKVNEFIEAGCLFQLNANSTSGLLGSESKKLAEIFLKNRIYSFIGSDAHGIGKRNTNIDIYKKDIEKIELEFFSRIEKNSENMLMDQYINFQIKKIKNVKKSMFSFLKK